MSATDSSALWIVALSAMRHCTGTRASDPCGPVAATARRLRRRRAIVERAARSAARGAGTALHSGATATAFARAAGSAFARPESAAAAFTPARAALDHLGLLLRREHAEDLVRAPRAQLRHRAHRLRAALGQRLGLRVVVVGRQRQLREFFA